jgi:hypothetical protein
MENLIKPDEDEIKGMNRIIEYYCMMIIIRKSDWLRPC